MTIEDLNKINDRLASLTALLIEESTPTRTKVPQQHVIDGIQTIRRDLLQQTLDFCSLKEIQEAIDSLYETIENINLHQPPNVMLRRICEDDCIYLKNYLAEFNHIRRAKKKPK